MQDYSFDILVQKLLNVLFLLRGVIFGIQPGNVYLLLPFLLPPLLSVLLSLPLAAALSGVHSVFYNLVAVPFHVSKTNSDFDFLAAGIYRFFLRLRFPGASV